MFLLLVKVFGILDILKRQISSRPFQRLPYHRTQTLARQVMKCCALCSANVESFDFGNVVATPLTPCLFPCLGGGNAARFLNSVELGWVELS